MNRIDSIFNELRGQSRGALMPFVTAGYPNLDVTRRLLPKIEAAGAQICELGIPFSDPIADGPVIQASMTDALQAGTTPGGVFDVVKQLRAELSMGLVAMVSYSIVHRIGTEAFVSRAADAGFDGFIFPDLPPEEALAIRNVVQDAGMTCSYLIAPTTPDDRAMELAKASSGFVYQVALTGITGERDRLPEGLIDRIKTLRGVTDLPIAVGFGVSNADHVQTITEVADAAIVGSALIRRMGDAVANDSDPAETAGSFVRELASGLR